MKPRDTERKGKPWQGDYEIIEHVFKARYLTTKQIGRLYYKGSLNKERLRFLFDKGYLKRRVGSLNQPYVYFLGLLGRRYIVRQGDFSRDDVDRIAGTAGGYEAPIPHDLQVAETYVRAYLECRDRGWTLNWRNEMMLIQDRLEINPDGYLCVETPTLTQEAFIEVTLDIQTRKEISARLEAYGAFWERFKPIMVLWFTTSPAKATKLQDVIKTFRYKDYIAVTLLDDAERFLTEPIWWWSEAKDKVCLIDVR